MRIVPLTAVKHSSPPFAMLSARAPWGVGFDWPKDVKQVAFTITTGKAGGAAAEISAPGYSDANKADYKAALEAVVPMAISKAQAQKTRKTAG